MSINITFIFCTYLLIINLTGFFLMGIDKKRAKENQWRISEKTLFLTALLAGSLGSIAGMYFFRHKTKHTTFKIGMPCILILQIILLLYFLT